jgi:hypothetical protein
MTAAAVAAVRMTAPPRMRAPITASVELDGDTRERLEILIKAQAL